MNAPTPPTDGAPTPRTDGAPTPRTDGAPTPRTDGAPTPRTDGAVPPAARLADIAAIEGLAIAYAHAVDDRDWARWEALFTPAAFIDYTSAGGISGTPAELAAWLPEAFAAFEWCMHSMSTHEITLTGDNDAIGRIHVFNRNGVTFDGRPEILDVGAVYEDSYVRVAGAWRFARRVEHTRYIDGGGFAAMVRDSVPGSGW